MKISQARSLVSTVLNDQISYERFEKIITTLDDKGYSNVANAMIDQYTVDGLRTWKAANMTQRIAILDTLFRLN